MIIHELLKPKNIPCGHHVMFCFSKKMFLIKSLILFLELSYNMTIGSFLC